MQLMCILRGEEDLTLPLSYHEIVQHFIYQSLAQRKIASFLRREGFSDGSRKMKLFTFSRLIGNYSLNLEHKTITFSKDIALVFASPVELIVWELTEFLLKSSCIWIGDCALQVRDVFFEDSFQGSDELEVIMLSPITVYQTHINNGKKHTVYFSPFEPTFEQLIKSNLQRKWRLVYCEDNLGDEFSIYPLEVSARDKKVIRFRDTVIEGWMGRYTLKGDPRFIKMGLDAGLGSKNSQGFGLALATDGLLYKVLLRDDHMPKFEKERLMAGP